MGRGGETQFQEDKNFHFKTQLLKSINVVSLFFIQTMSFQEEISIKLSRLTCE